MADQSLKIGRIFGIDIELHWTLVALLLFTLFLNIYGGGFLFVLIVLLFASVLIHELSHAIVALRNKVRVRRIILLPLGGATMIDQFDLHPKVEFNIAVAGPITSILLGAICGILVVFAPPGILAQVLQFLFLINILLGVFNILPAFPTDGGRVFRSYFERKYDEYKATMITIKAGKIVMVLFIVGTVVYLVAITASFFYKEFFFLWNLIIVFFLYGGAQAEQEAVTLKRDSKGMHVSDVVSKNFVFVEPDETIPELYERMRRTRVHLLITKIDRDYAYVNLLERQKVKSNMTARQMATKIVSLSVNTNIVSALESIEASELGIAAVTSGGKLVGIVTLTHIQAFLTLHLLSKNRARR